MDKVKKNNTLRVISGEAKGRKLKMVEGDTTRPITDRVKENLFNLIQWIVPECYFLDLFAGTGSVGIEALSRGANQVVFLEKQKNAVQVIKENLAHCRLEERSIVYHTDSFTFLANDPRQAFNIIYVAPPQYKEMWIKALEILDEKPGWLAEDGVVIVQIHPKEFKPLELVNFTLIDQRKYGSTMLCIYQIGVDKDNKTD